MQHTEAAPGVDTARGVRSSAAPAASPPEWAYVIGLPPLHVAAWRRCTRSSQSCTAADLFRLSLPRPAGGTRLHMNGSLLHALPGGRRSQVGELTESSAPCHALPGRVGSESCVIRAYDLAQYELADDDMRGVRPRRQNKGMKLTKGGWSRSDRVVGGSRHGLAHAVGRHRRSSPSQLIPGVRPTLRGDALSGVAVGSSC